MDKYILTGRRRYWRCEEHFLGPHYGDKLPCPWPECLNGVQNGILSTFNPEYQRKEVFERVKWLSWDKSGFCYSWEKQGSPYFSSLEKLVPQEIERRMGFYPPPDGFVYHYTNMEGLKGIIEDCGMRLTDFSSLEDESEIHGGIKVARHILQEFRKEACNKEGAEFFKVLLSDLEGEPCPSRAYIACFTIASPAILHAA